MAGLRKNAPDGAQRFRNAILITTSEAVDYIVKGMRSRKWLIPLAPGIHHDRVSSAAAENENRLTKKMSRN